MYMRGEKFRGARNEGEGDVCASCGRRGRPIGTHVCIYVYICKGTF